MLSDAQREGNRQPEGEARREPTAQLLAVRLTVGLDLGVICALVGKAFLQYAIAKCIDRAFAV